MSPHPLELWNSEEEALADLREGDFSNLINVQEQNRLRPVRVRGRGKGRSGQSIYLQNSDSEEERHFNGRGRPDSYLDITSQIRRVVGTKFSDVHIDNYFKNSNPQPVCTESIQQPSSSSSSSEDKPVEIPYIAKSDRDQNLHVMSERSFPPLVKQDKPKPPPLSVLIKRNEKKKSKS